uniref:Uncharacterized protein n=1 Tax=Setaria italica TaxID=4555 RepID=K3ZXU1_SETIT
MVDDGTCTSTCSCTCAGACREDGGLNPKAYCFGCVLAWLQEDGGGFRVPMAATPPNLRHIFVHEGKGGELQCTAGTNAQLHTGGTIYYHGNVIGMYLHHNEHQYCNRQNPNFCYLYLYKQKFKHCLFLTKKKESANHIVNLCLRIP